MKSRIAIAALLTTLAGLLVFSFQSSPCRKAYATSSVKTPAPPIVTVASARQFRELVEAEKQIEFYVDVDWSFTAVAGRPIVQKFRQLSFDSTKWHALPIYRVDLTGSEEVYDAVDGWLRNKSVPNWNRHLGSGAGTLLWVADGNPVHAFDGVVLTTA